MNRLPEPPARQPHAPQAGQPATVALTDAVIQAAVENAIDQARRNDASPQAVIGNTPAVPQPGIPPQSRAAVDYAVRVLSTGVATALASGSLSLVMYVSRFADPLVCGIVFGTPIGLAIPIAALSNLTKRTKEVVQAAPPVIHQHYNAPVTHHTQTLNTDNRGLWATTRNQLPR